MMAASSRKSLSFIVSSCEEKYFWNIVENKIDLPRIILDTESDGDHL